MKPTSTPRFTLKEAADLATRAFGVIAIASPLPSERDQNFALTNAAGTKFVLKIAKSDEERGVLELQNAALRHIAQRTQALALPQLIAGPSGENIATIESAGGQPYFMRLVTWVDGEILVKVQPHDQALLASLGAAMAELDLGLQGFSHPAMHRELLWDVKHADLALQHLPLLSKEKQAMVRRFMTAWEAVNWASLRHGVIHGDANDYNVLVRQGQVAGLIDFGDIVHSAVVCDLAIALAYVMLDKPDPLAVATSVIRAYSAKFPLTNAEVGALYPLTSARLCLSVCYSAYNAQVKPGDDYQLVTVGPAWHLLQQLDALRLDTVQSAFRQAWETS